MNIFVGNLSFDATETDVKKLFEGFGSIVSLAIVMQKDGKKSRGFAFVEMPDDQEAHAAIAALAGKEFMGRPLNVEAARPKSGAGPESRKRRKMRSEINIGVQQHPLEEKDHKNARFNPVFHKTGGYKGGSRSRGFMMRRAAAGIEEQAMPQRKSQENPMRWRKKREQPESWQKSQGESKPWKKAEGDSRSRKKARGEAKPWSKSNERPQKSSFKSYKKSGGYKRG